MSPSCSRRSDADAHNRQRSEAAAGGGRGLQLSLVACCRLQLRQVDAQAAGSQGRAGVKLSIGAFIWSERASMSASVLGSM